jgi:hypothetical protein
VLSELLATAICPSSSSPTCWWARDRRRRGRLPHQRRAGHRRDHRFLHAHRRRPFDFGRIAATNALSDIYAMGGTPLMALAIVGMPINVLPHDVIAKILEGGESVCRDAGIRWPAATPSTRSSPSTAWWASASSTPSR